MQCLHNALAVTYVRFWHKADIAVTTSGLPVVTATMSQKVRRPQGAKGGETHMSNFWRRAGAIALIAFCTLIIPNLAKAADSIRVGLSVALTGGVAPAGKQVPPCRSGATTSTRREA